MSSEAGTAQEGNEDNRILINVRLLRGNLVPLTVDRSMRLSDFRNLVAEHVENIPLDQQRLLYRGRILSDEDAPVGDIVQESGHYFHLVRLGRSAGDGAQGSTAVGGASGGGPPLAMPAPNATADSSSTNELPRVNVNVAGTPAGNVVMHTMQLETDGGVFPADSINSFMRQLHQSIPGLVTALQGQAAAGQVPGVSHVTHNMTQSAGPQRNPSPQASGGAQPVPMQPPGFFGAGASRPFDPTQLLTFATQIGAGPRGAHQVNHHRAAQAACAQLAAHMQAAHAAHTAAHAEALRRPRGSSGAPAQATTMWTTVQGPQDATHSGQEPSAHTVPAVPTFGVFQNNEQPAQVAQQVQQVQNQLQQQLQQLQQLQHQQLPHHQPQQQQPHPGSQDGQTMQQEPQQRERSSPQQTEQPQGGESQMQHPQAEAEPTPQQDHPTQTDRLPLQADQQQEQGQSQDHLRRVPQQEQQPTPQVPPDPQMEQSQPQPQPQGHPAAQSQQQQSWQAGGIFAGPASRDPILMPFMRNAWQNLADNLVDAQTRQQRPFPHNPAQQLSSVHDNQQHHPRTVPCNCAGAEEVSGTDAWNSAAYMTAPMYPVPHQIPFPFPLAAIPIVIQRSNGAGLGAGAAGLGPIMTQDFSAAPLSSNPAPVSAAECHHHNSLCHPHDGCRRLSRRKHPCCRRQQGSPSAPRVPSNVRCPQCPVHGRHRKHRCCRSRSSSHAHEHRKHLSRHRRFHRRESSRWGNTVGCCGHVNRHPCHRWRGLHRHDVPHLQNGRSSHLEKGKIGSSERMSSESFQQLQEDAGRLTNALSNITISEDGVSNAGVNPSSGVALNELLERLTLHQLPVDADQRSLASGFRTTVDAAQRVLSKVSTSLADGGEANLFNNILEAVRCCTMMSSYWASAIAPVAEDEPRSSGSDEDGSSESEAPDEFHDVSDHPDCPAGREGEGPPKQRRSVQQQRRGTDSADKLGAGAPGGEEEATAAASSTQLEPSAKRMKTEDTVSPQTEMATDPNEDPPSAAPLIMTKPKSTSTDRPQTIPETPASSSTDTILHGPASNARTPWGAAGELLMGALGGTRGGFQAPEVKKSREDIIKDLPEDVGRRFRKWTENPSEVLRESRQLAELRPFSSAYTSGDVTIPLTEREGGDSEKNHPNPVNMLTLRWRQAASSLGSLEIPPAPRHLQRSMIARSLLDVHSICAKNPDFQEQQQRYPNLQTLNQLLKK